MNAEVIVGAGVFTAVVMSLVVIVLVARTWLVAAGETTVTVNDERRLQVPIGDRLLGALSAHGVLLPSACGGRGTCGQCRVTVQEGGGPPAPVEAGLLTAHEVATGVRLACQVMVRKPIKVVVPREVLGVRRWTCRVRSTRNVATLMKEIVLELPEGEHVDFNAGAYVLVHCPPHATTFDTLEIDVPFRDEWTRLGLWTLRVESTTEETRAYSLASHPGERGIVMLLVRIATPPPAAPAGTPAGVVSSWLFARRPGDAVDVAGPYGTFAAVESEREMVFVGGGAGMAPMRSIVFDQLLNRHTTRPMTFWYGARNLRELLYREDFDRLAAEHACFSWHVALSEPRPEDAWEGDTGFIHEVLYERHLKEHPAPEECEYYLCGPPMMIQAVFRLLDSLGVERESIHFDDFGT